MQHTQKHSPPARQPASVHDRPGAPRPDAVVARPVPLPTHTGDGPPKPPPHPKGHPMTTAPQFPTRTAAHTHYAAVLNNIADPNNTGAHTYNAALTELSRELARHHDHNGDTP